MGASLNSYPLKGDLKGFDNENYKLKNKTPATPQVLIPL